MLDRTIAPPVKDFVSLSMPPLKQVKLDNGTVANIINNGDQEVFSLTAVCLQYVLSWDRSHFLQALHLATDQF